MGKETSLQPNQTTTEEKEVNKVMSYEISRINTTTEDVQVQGTDKRGNKREFSLVINRDLVTNELSVGVVRHFTDPHSIPWFSDSEPWTEGEVRGDN